MRMENSGNIGPLFFCGRQRVPAKQYPLYTWALGDVTCPGCIEREAVWAVRKRGNAPTDRSE